MNTQAERHLAKAEGYFAKGEAWYRKAAAEIVAAKEVDSSLSNAKIGERFGRTHKWVGDLIAWQASGSALPTPWTGEQDDRGGRNLIGARKLLREAPLEQIEQLIAGLPKDRQQAIGAAAGHGYLVARQDYDDEQKNLTPAEKSEREAAAAAMKEGVEKAAGGFLSLGIAGHLEQATEELQELDSPTEESMRIIIAADADWRTELQVKVAMVGLDYAPVEV